jgi:DNA-binding transcriptional MerR regulator
MPKNDKNINPKENNLVSPQAFLKKFPTKVKDLSRYYAFNIKPSISDRTLRYYVTKGLMPSPMLLGKKAYYKDNDNMHRRLFCVWYLIHFKRATIKAIKKIMHAKWLGDNFEAFLLLLDDKMFIDGFAEEIEIYTDEINSNYLAKYASHSYKSEDRLLAIGKIIEHLVAEERGRIKHELDIDNKKNRSSPYFLVL